MRDSPPLISLDLLDFQSSCALVISGSSAKHLRSWWLGKFFAFIHLLCGVEVVVKWNLDG